MTLVLWKPYHFAEVAPPRFGFAQMHPYTIVILAVPSETER
jgi:hypothetical protein